jgi:hypothetical protein
MPQGAITDGEDTDFLAPRYTTVKRRAKKAANASDRPTVEA